MTPLCGYLSITALRLSIDRGTEEGLSILAREQRLIGFPSICIARGWSGGRSLRVTPQAQRSGDGVLCASGFGALRARGVKLSVQP
jgi:hypothetical protein